MSILLCTVSPYLGVLGGSERANRALIEDLAARGHRCAVLAPAKVGDGKVAIRDKLRELDITAATRASCGSSSMVSRSR